MARRAYQDRARSAARTATIGAARAAGAAVAEATEAERAGEAAAARTGAERIERDASATQRGSERVRAASATIGSAARQARLADALGGRGATNGRGATMRRAAAQAAARHAAARAAESRQAVRDDLDAAHGDPDALEVTYRGEYVIDDSVGTLEIASIRGARASARAARRIQRGLAATRRAPMHEVQTQSPKATLRHDTARDVATANAVAVSASALEGVRVAEDADIDAGLAAHVVSRAPDSTRGHGLVARLAAASEHLETDAVRRHRRLTAMHRSATRSVGSSSVAAALSGDETLVPVALRATARQARRAASRAALSLVTTAATAVAAAAAAVLPMLAPLALAALVVVAIAGGVASALAHTGLGGGAAIAAVAEAEYASGVADGTRHYDDPKYWDHVAGGGFVSGDGGYRTPWCACFVTWCADQVGLVEQGVVPASATAFHDEWYAAHPDLGSAGTMDALYQPRPGDFIIYNHYAGDGAHVGLVTTVEAEGFWTVEGNTGGPAGNGSSQVNRKWHERVATASGVVWTNTNWGALATYGRPNYPASGAMLEIPAPYGSGGYTVTEYDLWFGDWARGTRQRAVADEWARKGARWTDDIASIDGRYLVACTTTYGQVGDRLTFYLDDGTQIACVMADAKSMGDPGCNQWGHSNGMNVLEFEVRSARFRRDGNPGSAAWMPGWSGRRVVGCVNETRGSARSEREA